MPASVRSRKVWGTVLTAVSLCALLLSSCAKYPTDPSSSTNSSTVQQFLTPWTDGGPDDYLLFASDFDAPQYSLFLDDSDFKSANTSVDSDHHHEYSHELTRHGHGFGREDDRGHREHGNNQNGEDGLSWTDSLQLTDAQKLSIDTAIKMLHNCADTVLAAFRVQLQPYRTEFATRRSVIRAELDSELISRDSARVLLDSAIATYFTKTAALRVQLRNSIQPCLDELDVFVKVRLTASQYDIWVRHRGW